LEQKAKVQTYGPQTIYFWFSIGKSYYKVIITDQVTKNDSVLAFVNKIVMHTSREIESHKASPCECQCNGTHILKMTHQFKNKAEEIMFERMLNAKLLLDLEVFNVIESKELKGHINKNTYEIIITYYSKMKGYTKTKTFKEWD
jgi:hypothetical protein